MTKKEERKERKKPGPSDFSNEYQGLKVFVKTINEGLEGRLIEASKFWLKLEANNEVYYINKGQVIYIKPFEKPIEKPKEEIKEAKKEIPKMPWLR
jgi:hypothetical protein